MPRKHAKPTKKQKRKARKNEEELKLENTKLKIFKRIIFIIVFIAIILLAIMSALAINNWKTIAEDMINNKNSQVFDINRNIIAELGGERKQFNISEEQVPETLKNAYVAIEDERFYKHHGVDIKRTTAAIVSYVFHRGSSSFGGSTITQQLVKNMTGDTSSSATRKVKEWAMAFELECFFSKEQILNTYLNVIYVGPNVYGVGAGAKYYFNKDISNLSVAECAYLAGLNHSPNSYNPFGDKDNSEKIEKRTKTVLSKMLEKKYISQEEYDEAVKEIEQELKFENGDIETKNNGVYSYHTDALLTEVISELQDKKHISKEFATNYLYMGGLKIYSAQDSSIQEDMETEFEKSKYILKSKQQQGETSQAAMVIINHENGQVVGCVGGIGEKTKAREFNRATMSLRQTGSASKPIAVLAPAISKRKITAATKFDDVATTFTNIDGTEYAPGDYDPYQGSITVRRAVESSQNIPFVKIIEEIKPKTSIKYLKKMGVSNLTEKDNNLALALGGEEKGLSPLEMAAGYATIANDGKYIEPTFYTRITDEAGTDVLKTKQKTRKVFSKEVAYILKSLLKQPVEGTQGTATYCEIDGMDVAAKTGTTNENYDRWLCGFTNYYTASTWYGYDMNETINYDGKNPAGLIWAEIMKNIHSNLKGTKFEMPSGVKTATICKDTGCVANSGCKDTYTEYFLFGTVPGKCIEHSEKKTTEKTTNNNSTTNTNKNTTKQENTSSEEKNEVVENKTTNNTKKNNTSENKTTTKNNTTNTSTNTNKTSNTTNTQNTTNTSINTTNKNTQANQMASDD